ncbi:MAG: radical SAM protein, partial [Endomicrobiales bacterium]
HRMTNPKIGHVDFFDLAFDGDIRKVEEFSKLMIMYPPYDPRFRFQWNANAIITPKLTPALLKLMKASGCQRLIFGIESGSEQVLKLMRKKYEPEVAVRVIKDAFDAGIKVTCNFMFGFPGETEEDFQKTLDFTRRIGPYVERLYPSRTYCALEEYSYFHEHPEEFGIKTPFNHHLYWETEDGANTYPVRLERCRRFEEFCAKNGVRVDCGVRTSVELDNWFSLGMYYEYKKDYDKVLDCYHQYLKLDPRNTLIIERVKEALPRAPRWEGVFKEFLT